MARFVLAFCPTGRAFVLPGTYAAMDDHEDPELPEEELPEEEPELEEEKPEEDPELPKEDPELPEETLPADAE
eukprot:3915411-Pyramimonas_sp.AAC.3